MDDLSNLSAEEIEDLNKLNFVAFDLVRLTSKLDNQIPPCWLCMSKEAKDKAVKDLQRYISTNMGRNFSRSELEDFAQNGVNDGVLTQWRGCEAHYKRLREEDHNPRAWFAD